MNSVSTCKVAKVMSETELVLNKGSNSGIKNGMRFLIYEVTDENIVDPDTNQSLGKLEVVKGTGIVIHVQDNIATIKSDQFEQTQPKKIIRTSGTNAWGPIFQSPRTEEIIEPFAKELLPFDNPKIGDYAKRI